MEIKRILLASGMGLLLILAGTGAFAWLILQRVIDITHLDLMAAAVLIFGSGGTALLSGAGEGSGKRTLLSEGVLVLLLLGLNLVLFDGSLTGVLPCVVLMGGTAGGICLLRMGKTGKNVSKSRRKKRAVVMLNKKSRR